MPNGISFRNLGTDLQARVLPRRGTGSGGTYPVNTLALAQRPGASAQGYLSVAANVADTETVVIGADTYEIETVATAIGGGAVAAGGTFNSTADPKQITITAHGLVAGDLIACQTEICQLLSVIDVNTVVVSRGRYGTTAATHADGQTINKGNGITAGRIPVGFIATFTPTVAIPALVDAINNPLHGGYRPVAKSSTIYATIVASADGTIGVIVVYKTPGTAGNAIATTETLAGANNAWMAATLVGGKALGNKSMETQIRAPVAAEVTLGTMAFAFPFQIGYARVDAIITSSGINKAWVGGWVIVNDSTNNIGVLKVDNAGATDWATTDKLYVTAVEL